MTKSSLTKSKIIYTSFIMLIYCIARLIPLVGVDTTEISRGVLDAEHIFSQAISGDLNKCSALTLGIAPYMLSTIPVSIISACRSADAKAHTSSFTMNRIAIGLMLVFASLQAVLRLGDFTFRTDYGFVPLLKVGAVVQMVAGAFFILFLSERNKKYGIGGQTALIYINILDGIISNLMSHSLHSLIGPILISCVGMIIILIMENTEIRFPMQRISIYNIYEDKNYQAIKLNPIGIMPIMFASAFFMLPQMIAKLLLSIYPESVGISTFIENDTMTKPLGIAIYICILFVLTIAFAFVFISPRDISEQMLKSGDSLVQVPAGRKTYRYLCKKLAIISIISATVMSICMGIPMIMQLYVSMDNSLIMLPSSIMMLTGIWCSLYQEFRGIRNLDAYKPFITTGD